MTDYYATPFASVRNMIPSNFSFHSRKHKLNVSIQILNEKTERESLKISFSEKKEKKRHDILQLQILHDYSDRNGNIYDITIFSGGISKLLESLDIFPNDMKSLQNQYTFKINEIHAIIKNILSLNDTGNGYISTLQKVLIFFGKKLTLIYI